MTCAKQIVTATIITESGCIFVGTNAVANPQERCPRSIGDGYEKCKSICHQYGHAEIVALRQAGTAAMGATLYLTGHSYACEECYKACMEAGIKEVIIIKKEII